MCAMGPAPEALQAAASLRPSMSRRSLRPQLNQIRGWVRQGRTDAWIAHQLEVTVQQIQAFKREQGLEPDAEDNGAELEEEAKRRAEEEAAAAEEAARKAAEEEARAAEEAARREAEDSDDDDKPKRASRRRG